MQGQTGANHERIYLKEMATGFRKDAAKVVSLRGVIAEYISSTPPPGLYFLLVFVGDAAEEL